MKPRLSTSNRSRNGGGVRLWGLGTTTAAALAICTASGPIVLGAAHALAQPPPRDRDAGAHVDSGAASRDAAIAPANRADAGSPGVSPSSPTAAARDAGDNQPSAAHASENAIDAGVAQATAAALDTLDEALRPVVTTSRDPSGAVTIGDVFKVRLVAETRGADTVAVPEQPFAPFEVLGTEHQEADLDTGRKRYTFELTLLALEPGEHTIGPILLRVVTADGTIGTMHADTITVEVASLLGNEPDAEAKPPSEPVQVMQDDATLWWILGTIGALLLTAILTLVASWWWRRRPRKIVPPPPPRPPWETALERLAALGRTRISHLENDGLVDWVDGVSDTLREYLGARFGFDGLESTTDEIIGRLRRQKNSAVPLTEITAILGDCDLVKFAKATPNDEQTRELLGAAQRIVRDTMPMAQPVTAARLAVGAAPAVAASPAPIAPPNSPLVRPAVGNPDESDEASTTSPADPEPSTPAGSDPDPRGAGPEGAGGSER